MDSKIKHPYFLKEDICLIMTKTEKTLVWIAYLLCYGITVLYFYFFLNSEVLLATNTGQSACKHTDKMFVFNGFWENQICLLSLEGVLTFYMPIIFYFFIIFIFLFFVQNKLMPDENNTSFYVWGVLCLVYFIFILYRLIELDLLFVKTFVGAFIGTVRLFTPIFIFQILIFIFKQKS